MNKAGKLFLKGLLKSFIGVTLLLGVTLISYHFVSRLFYIPEEEKTVSAGHTEGEEAIIRASVDDISRNLIFCVDEQGEVRRLLLEVFHCEQGRLYYLTIPTETGITMSDSLYRRLILVNPSVPQLLKLSGITEHFPKESAYAYGVLLVEELLKIKMSYYTVMPAPTYDKIFQTEEPTETVGEAGEGKGQTIYPREIFSEGFISVIQHIRTEEELQRYIEELYEEIESNLSLEDKMNYFDSYLKLAPARITFELLAGEPKNSGYVPDGDKVAEQLARITGQVR